MKGYKGIKKILLIIFLSTNLLVINNNVYAENNKIIKVGYINNFGVINSPILEGQKGYGYELLSILEDYSDYEFEYVPIDFNDIYNKLSTNEIDIFMPIKKIDETNIYHDDLIYCDFSFGKEDTRIITHKPDVFYVPNKSIIYNNINIATEPYSYQENKLKEFLDTNNYDSNIIHYDEYNINYDFIVISSLYSNSDYTIIDTIDSRDTYITALNKNKHIIDNLNKAYNKFNTEQPYEHGKLYSKYYNDSNNELIIREDIKNIDNKEFNVIYDPNYYPLSFNTSNKPDGLKIDILSYIQDNTNIKFNFYDENNIDNNIIPDIKLSSLNSDDTNKWKQSDILLELPLVILKKENVENKDIKNITVPDFAHVKFNKLQSMYPNANIKRVKSMDICLDEFSHNKTDAIVTINYNLDILTIKYYLSNYETIYYDTKYPLLFSISSNYNSEYIEEFNKLLNSIDNDIISNIEIENNKVFNEQITINQKLYKNRDLNVFILIIVLILSFILILLFNFKKRIDMISLLEHDQLTKLYSKDKFIIEVNKILMKAKNNEYLLLYLDIDSFYSINNNYGHDTGTKILTNISIVLNKLFPNAIKSRVYSDHFVLLLKNKYSIEELKNDYLGTNNINKMVEELSDIKFNMHISKGIYIINDINLSVDTMLAYANYARIQEKSIFANTLTIFTDDMLKEIKINEEINHKLEKSFNERRFYPVFQPQININTNKIIGAELLIRWKTESGSTYYPDVFIPLLENNKFIYNIDCFMFEQACLFLVENPNLDIKLSINLSAVTILNQDIVNYIREQIIRYDINVDKLELEVTESALVNSSDTIIDRIKEINNLGISTAIDDFGSGVSSLSRLKYLDVKVLKLDKSFVDKYIVGYKGLTIINSIVSLAHKLGLKVIAEGIERKDQLTVISQLGINIIQGYYFSKPLRKNEFISYINNFYK